MTSIGDPRVWPPAAAAPPHARALHQHAEKSLTAATSPEAEQHNGAIAAAFRALIEKQDGTALSRIFESAPSAAIYRHLWRELVRVEAASDDSAMAMTVFALPLTIVTGREGDEDAAETLPCVLSNVAEIATLLREHGALRGNQTFALANTLVAADAIDVAKLPPIYARRELRDGSGAITPRDLSAAPIVVDARDARVHLRFIVGVAVAARGVDLVADNGVGKWGMPLTRLLGRALAQHGVTLLILPHAPKRLCVALQQGRAAQREVSAQLFASGAIRKMRASVGEPVAALSAHHAFDAPAGGELRLSLSSVFDPAQAEGFCCPLYRADQTSDVVNMLLALLQDCRVSEIRVLPGVHPDRDPTTGVRLLFKADALADSPPSNVTMQ
jgi:hypothetical protein